MENHSSSVHGAENVSHPNRKNARKNKPGRSCQMCKPWKHKWEHKFKKEERNVDRDKD